MTRLTNLSILKTQGSVTIFALQMMCRAFEIYNIIYSYTSNTVYGWLSLVLLVLSNSSLSSIWFSTELIIDQQSFCDYRKSNQASVCCHSSEAKDEFEDLRGMMR